jgi:hypothetical protein
VTLPLSSNSQVFLLEKLRLPEGGWKFSQDILYKFVSFQQRQVKVESILDKHAYNILNFGFIFHADSILPLLG